MTDKKPICKVTGSDGNVFSVMARVIRALRDAGMNEEADKVAARVPAEAQSYHQALAIMGEYVELR